MTNVSLLKYSKGSLAIHRINVIPFLQGFIRFEGSDRPSPQVWGKTFLSCPHGNHHRQEELGSLSHDSAAVQNSEKQGVSFNHHPLV